MPACDGRDRHQPAAVCPIRDDTEEYAENVGERIDSGGMPLARDRANPFEGLRAQIQDWSVRRDHDQVSTEDRIEAFQREPQGQDVEFDLGRNDSATSQGDAIAFLGTDGVEFSVPIASGTVARFKGMQDVAGQLDLHGRRWSRLDREPPFRTCGEFRVPRSLVSAGIGVRTDLDTQLRLPVRCIGRPLATATMKHFSIWRPFHESGDARVVYVDLALHAGRESDALDWLDQAERERRQRFHSPRARREFTLCRAALRSLLCGELGCGNGELVFDVQEFGKPLARVGEVRASVTFNVSHSGRHGLIGIAPVGRIGVDVEERSTNRDLDSMIRTLFAPGERNELESATGERKISLFYRLWTMKEALVKAVGDGLSLDPAGFEIPPAMVRGARTGVFRFREAPDVAWRLDDIGNAEFAAALAREFHES